jgi:hypothetical protein
MLMRHRFTLALYDESPIDVEILDYLASTPASKRQELLRGFCRAGFATLVQHKNASEAVVDSLDDDVSSMLIKILTNNAGGGINANSVLSSARSKDRGVSPPCEEAYAEKEAPSSTQSEYQFNPSETRPRSGYQDNAKEKNNSIIFPEKNNKENSTQPAENHFENNALDDFINGSESDMDDPMSKLSLFIDD